MSLPAYRLRTLVISIVATIGGFLFGFDSGVINGTVDGLQSAFNSNEVGTGFNVASMLLGCAAGAFFAGNLANQLGRRTVLIIASVFFIASAWGSGIANGSSEFILYRILGGLAVGAASVLAPAYISEIAPAEIRGRLASLQQIAIIAGLFSAFFSNYGITYLAGGSSQNVLYLDYAAWRWMFWVELGPAVLFFVALWCIPESPRFLVAAHKRERALKVMQRISPNAERHLEEIEASLRDDHRPRLSDVRGPAMGLQPVVWIGIILAALQQLIGINVVFYYGAVLWQSVGFTESNALLINVISGALSVLATLCALLFIDKLGRKPMLVAGSVGMTLTLGTMAAIFATAVSAGAAGEISLSGPVGIAALIAANGYVFIFNLTWGPVVWVTLAEMFPNRLRGAGMALSGLTLWLANFVITLTFPMLLKGFGLGFAYGIYAAFAAGSTFFVLKWVKEAKGRELEAIKG